MIDSVKKEHKEEVEAERLRRITGYLTTDVKLWNDAKRAEERDRVKHAGSDSLDNASK